MATVSCTSVAGSHRTTGWESEGGGAPGPIMKLPALE